MKRLRFDRIYNDVSVRIIFFFCNILEIKNVLGKKSIDIGEKR